MTELSGSEAETSWRGWVEAVRTLDGTLDTKEQKKRTLFFCYSAVAGVTTMVVLLSIFDEIFSQKLRLASYIMMALIQSTGVAAVLLRLPLRSGHIVVLFYAQSALLLLWDVIGRQVMSPAWPLLVLVIDMLLVMQVPARYTIGLVSAVVVWLFVLALEESFRFGILDLPGLIPQDGPFGRQQYYAALTSCGRPPCPVQFPPLSLPTSVTVFMLDFLATRGFARGILKEQEAMQQTINAVQEIASLLARYDVEGVARMLDVQETLLPEEMHATLRKMEGNLRKYRPYLPAALFEEEDEMCGAQHATVAPPGLDSEIATIVFTDIRASTSIWEAAPDGMRAGLRIHNAVIRDVMHTFGGYEVKTIGDAFMIAFATTQDGMDFALKVHERLREAEWPPSLMEDAPICAEQGLLWCGLTVRIGINTGPVTVEQSSLTGRTDYFGHTVNVASRLESSCTPGAVAIRSDLWTSDCGSLRAFVGESEAVDLKGVSGTTFVLCVWPAALAGRKANPLRDKWRAGVDGSDSSHKSNLSMSPREFARQMTLPKPFDATLGVVELLVGEDGHAHTLHNMSAGLSILTVSLDQSGGTLVSVLGNCVCIGWNLTRASSAHMEAALRFAQRVQDSSHVSGAGFVSGVVQHGDVGARKQRFVTVMGSTVRRSWTLCEEAVRCGNVCLYELPSGALPKSLEHMIVAHKASSAYRVVSTAKDVTSS